ncbi:MAG: VWA domain-containing protein [Deltaproteobacteria bacterium]|nr:VWA domain-containing protein [Deltaproteobacteria bacterium]MDQ3296271.1 MopE-related protein [Myxococcota bacterium]
MRLLSSALLASTAALLLPDVAVADTCEPARVMVVFDKSSSMVTGKIGTQTKWDVAVGGLGQVLGAYETKAEFGLMSFPSPNQCGPGVVNVAPAMANRNAIMGSLSTPPPTTGNWTPMAQTLSAAADEPSLLNAVGPRHVVLVTDGWQWCSPYDSTTRFDGVDAVTKLNAKGITTWVVGFGSEVDAAALNQMAVAANTMRPNCNAGNTDPASPDQCYFQVDNAAELVTALTAIAGNIVAVELCDGMDNDCDGEVDEDLTRDCSTDCGAGTETCQAGAWKGCTAPTPSPETCDGDDNDCDGDVDEPDSPLCDSGDVCTSGACEPPNAGTGEMQAGCGCETSGPDAGTLAPFLALGLLLVRRRRSR